MKKTALALLTIAFVGMNSFGQSQRTRPRVAPTPAPPVIKGEQPPVLGTGDRNSTEPAQSQDTETVAAGDDDVVRVDTNLVTMPVSVLDHNGRFVGGLGQGDFKIFENGIEQDVEYFQSVESPFTVILMIDVSPSTQWRIEDIQQAAISFVDQLRENDKVMVVAFDDHVQVLSPITNNRSVLRSAIRRARFGDGTGLYEAVDHVISQELRRIEGRKAVVLFTDGVDTTSRRATYQSTVREVEETDALFYPIRYDTSRDMDPYGGYGGGGGGIRIGLPDIFGGILNGGSWPMPRRGGGGRGAPGTSRNEYDTGRRYLDTLAQNSGGRKFEADSLSNLDAAFAGIAEELRRQYSLGYYPDKVGQPGERRSIRVRVLRPNLVVRAKTSYVFGQDGSNFAEKQ